MKATLLNLPNTAKKAVFILSFATVVCFTFFSSFPPPLSLLAGIVIAVVTGHPYIAYNKKATTLLLQYSVVLLGFGMNLQHALKAGREGLIFTIATIAITLIASHYLGKWLKVDKNTSLLIGNGTAICGGSAIAAVAPIVRATSEQISVALGTVFILNSVALFVFPPIGHMLGMSATQFGTWCAIAIHDTSSVVGAAAGYTDASGHEALGIAATIKLERALWIIPISLGTAWFQKSTGKVKLPWFILWFVVAIIVSTYLPLYVPLIGQKFAGASLFQHLYILGRKGLVITLFLIGSGLSLTAIKSVGIKPMLQGLLLWILIGITSLASIMSFVH